MTRFTPSPCTLYLCDNAACYCGEHLGTTAAYSGCDISGQPVHAVTPADARYATAQGFSLYCESCGKSAAERAS